MVNVRIRIFVFGLCFLLNLICYEVQAQKTINHEISSWTGVFGSYRLSKNWGIVGDFLINRNNFYADPGFTWLKGGVGYWTNSSYFFSAGLALLWVPRPELTNAKNTLEYRIDPQVVSWKPLGKGTFLHRFRLDFRARQNIENNEVLNSRNMSYRFRYLYSYSLPVTKGVNPLSLVFVNEVLIQFGNKIVLNTFDQFRIFIGISRNITREFSFDFGYFPIYTQTAAGNIYTLNHNIRLFIFTDFKKKKSLPNPMIVKDFNEE